MIEIAYPDEQNPRVYSGHANRFTRMVEDENQMFVNINSTQWLKAKVRTNHISGSDATVLVAVP